MRTWRKSLRRAIRRYTDGCAARWPKIYRRLTDREVANLAKEHGPRLTGAVRYLSVREEGVHLWGGLVAVCKP